MSTSYAVVILRAIPFEYTWGGGGGGGNAHLLKSWGGGGGQDKKKIIGRGVCQILNKHGAGGGGGGLAGRKK